LAWLPDGLALVTVDRSSPKDGCGLFLLSVDAGEKQRLTVPAPGAGHDDAPAVSPDGHWLAFSRGNKLSQIYLLELTPDHKVKGQPKQITFDSQPANSPAWTPDGRSIVFTSGPPAQNGSLWRVAVSDGHPGVPERLPFLGEQVHDLAISPHGNRLVFSRSTGGEEIWKIDISARNGIGRPISLISSTGFDEDPQYSPDGKRIAFKSTRSGRFEIWVTNSDGSNPVQLSNSIGTGSWFPHWSPDGKTILFNSDPEGHAEMFLVSSHGGTTTRLTRGAGQNWAGSFSRDGKWIYFASDRTGESQIWKMPAHVNGSEGTAIQVTRNGGVYAIESPNGKYLYCLRRVAGTASPLVKVPVNGGKEIVVLPSVFLLNFAIADEGIYFVPEAVQKRYSIQFLSFSSGKVRRIAEIKDPSWVLAVSPGPKADVRSILYTQGRVGVRNLMLVENFR
jgi:Tol biopolymer transport system component